MRNSILTKFFIGYFSFAVLGFLLITYWSTNLIYNHLVQDDAKQLNSYASVVSDNIKSLDIESLDDISSPDNYFSDFNRVLNCNLLVLDNNKKMIYTTDKTQELNNDEHTIVFNDFDPTDYSNGSYRIGKLYNISKTDTLSVVHTLAKDDITYGYVVAHIGDEQSIEQSLSTFSAHMVNTVNILDKADQDSLVLFDELGAGTDPVEGAALGISILNFLKNMGTRTMATTHYSELKLYALSTDGVQNASCEFDVETLRPTYRLLIGIPGKSNAFAISEKLGLPKFIINDAKSRIDAEDEQFEDVLAELERQKKQIEKDHETISVYKSQIASLKKDYEYRTKEINEKKDKILSKAREEALDILKEAKETADTAIKNINKYGKSGNTKELEKSRTAVGSKIKKNQSHSSIKASKPSKSYKASDFKLGTGVKVLSMNLNGTVASLPNAAGNLTVKMGILNSKVNIRDLEIIDEPDIKAPGLTRNSSGKIKMNKSLNVKMEINLIGKTVDEALGELEKYLDDAYIAHLPQVYVIHGKGTGTLRKAVQNYLKTCSYVKSYRNGEHGEGGAGATVVEFK